MPLWSRLDRHTSSPRLDIAVLAVLSYIPLLLTAPGVVGADTKPYLYLDPAKLLSGAPYMWLENVGMGTVPHQNIGYLWPMGPFFWVFDTLGFPDWVAQRLWLATIMFAAGLGVRYMLRAIGWANGGILIASMAYMLSPYPLSYVARISVLLLPWAGLPWLVGLAAKALRHGGWRYPAGFALATMTIGGTNATSLLLIGLGPVAWLIHHWLTDDDITIGRLVATVVRIGVPTAATALWWVIGLQVQGSFGPSVLRYTETYRAVADSSTATEAFRGLGYWFFYGNDALGAWIEPSDDYTARVLLMILSFGLPILALAAAAITRWRHRSFFLVLIVLGGFITVGGHPYEDGSLLGNWFTEFTRTDTGLALRSTPRAAPLLVLGTSVLLGAAVAAFARWRPPAQLPLRLGVGLLIIANLPPLWTGQMVAKQLQRPEEIPDYWRQAIAEVDAQPHDTRILEVPGSDFSSYRWGNTVEPITPGLTDRPYVARELVPFGSEPATSLLIELDKGFQEGLYSPEAFTRIARLMGVGDVVFRGDLQYERFRTPRPVETLRDLRTTPGLEQPTFFGDEGPNVAGPEQTLIDGLELGRNHSADLPGQVAVFPVGDPLPIVRTRTTDRPLIVGGDAAGLIDAAAFGLLERDQMTVFAATFADRPDDLTALIGPADNSATLIITDSNRRQARRWGTIRENTGYIERADEDPAIDPGDYRLVVFDNPSAELQTVAIHQGATITASNYGNPVSLVVDTRPALSADGNRRTAWRVGAFDDVRGESLGIELDEPTTADSVRLLQPVNGDRNRWITRAQITVGRTGQPDISFVVDLDRTSRRGQGQDFAVPMGASAIENVSIEILATNIGERSSYLGLSGVGFAEVGLVSAGDSVLNFSEIIRLPSGLFAAADNLDERPVAVTLNRQRSDPREPVRSDGEVAMHRRFDLPVEMDFSIHGEARLSAAATDKAVLALLRSNDGPNQQFPSGMVTTSSSRLAGDFDSRPLAAFDHDVTTIFQTEFGPQPGGWIEATLDTPQTITSLDLALVLDERHSRPTEVELIVDGASQGLLALPRVAGTTAQNASEPLSISIPPVTGSTFRLVFTQVDEAITKEWYSRSFVALPIGIAEWDLGTAEPTPVASAAFEFDCRDDLLSINGQPVGLTGFGSIADLIERKPITISSCDPQVRLPAGPVDIVTADGFATALDIDRLLLASLDVRLNRDTLPEPRTSSPAPTTVDDGRTHTTLSIPPADEPYWLVLGQSYNDGWKATSDQLGDLGPPTLVDGFANGWLIDPATFANPNQPLEVSIEWTPQRRVWIALLLTVLAAAACVALWCTGSREARDGAPYDDPRLVRLEPPARPRLPVLAFGVIATIAFSALNLPRWHLAALGIGGLLVVATRAPQLARVLPWLATACLIVSGSYTTISRYRNAYPSGFGWPSFFESVHVVSVLALLLLAAEVVRVHLTGGETPRGVPPENPTAAEPVGTESA